MDTLTEYRQIIRTSMQEYAIWGRQDSFEPITTHYVYDDENGEYLILNVGHDTQWDRWIHVILFHAWIQDGIVWVAADNISPSVVTDLVKKGIPASVIRPATEQPFVRETNSVELPHPA